jgi:hypothetical protein
MAGVRERARSVWSDHKIWSYYLEWGVVVGSVSLGLTGAIFGALIALQSSESIEATRDVLFGVFLGGLIGVPPGAVLGTCFGALAGFLSDGIEMGIGLLSEGVRPLRPTGSPGAPSEVAPAVIPLARGSEAATFNREPPE